MSSVLLAALAAGASLAAACRPEPGLEADGGRRLSVWYHAGQAAERRALAGQIERFNARQDEVRVEATMIPEGAYNGQVRAAALAGDLPDVLELDGPYLYSYAWQGELLPMGPLLPPELRADLLPSILEQGTYRGILYSVGTFDSGLGLYARRSRLEAVGARLPDGPAEAWSVEELETVLARLAERDPDGAILDLKLNYGEEWLTYGFSPILQSAGADLIDRGDDASAEGVLNGPAAVAAMRRVQRWIAAGYVDPNLDDAAFTGGRVALSWVGHWEYERYREAAGEDLALLPLPDFGAGSRTGQGSWGWAVTTRCARPRDAMRFLRFLLEPEEVLAITRANGAVPARRSAIERSARYRPGGPLHLFVRQLTEGYAVPRPRTPAYPVISAAFAEAFRDIRNGRDVQAALDEAVRAIDRDIADNRGYPPDYAVRRLPEEVRGESAP